MFYRAEANYKTASATPLLRPEVFNIVESTVLYL